MGEMATKLNDKNLASVSQLCTQRNRDKRPSNAYEVMQAFNKRLIPWRVLAFIIVVLCLIALGLFLWQHGSMLHDDATLPYEADSLSFGNIEIIG